MTNHRTRINILPMQGATHPLSLVLGQDMHPSARPFTLRVIPSHFLDELSAGRQICTKQLHTLRFKM
ncbi:hypothetical protein ACO7_230007 [Thiomonas arsenitoxydans]|nr:hypothetical protein THICB2_560046 [Thiomonas sp. CB2]CQR30924.1 hypothetical protein ACO3_250007 [Thiomonas arsenitoxydans]VDY04190.1 protein of unknown function [Thiomonas sp. Bio17B3]VDY08637.1 protein of unknown function [Thiomonas sp. Sup16B3]VDY12437.1 conserved protein of unknown function [Thiomonas sp. OC7]